MVYTIDNQSTGMALAQGFGVATLEAWQALASKALKGAPLERLSATTSDGINIQPLYTAADAVSPAQLKLAERDRFAPWDIRQLFESAAPQALNAQILTDLKGGATSIEVLIGGASQFGLPVADLAAALEGVLFDLAPVALNAGIEAVPAARALDAVLTKAGADPDKARPVFGLDHFSPWMAQGGLPEAFEALNTEATALGLELAGRWPKARMFTAGGRGAHEAGASPAQELAVMLASGVDRLRACEAQGVGPEQAAGLITLRLAVGQDVVPEIAKLRAARLLWDRVLQACCVASAPANLQAVTSRRMLAANDAWTNVLRVTCATFAAATGGADVITALPLTAGLGGSSELARKIARNTQLVLMEESHLGHVIDPGAGAFAIEALTHDLAAASWAIFQQIEAMGGLASALRSGWLQSQVAASAAAQSRDAARMKAPIVGVSSFPLPGEALPEFEVLNQAGKGAPSADEIAPMTWTRLSEPFEQVRARGEAAGSPPVFCKSRYDPAVFSPRRICPQSSGHRRAGNPCNRAGLWRA
jgi:methylmalonyl-CoA mutase